MKEIIVTKASGIQVNFNQEKLRQSLKNAGAVEEQIEHVIKEITPQLYNGIPTKDIYRWAFKLLKNSSRHIAAKYHLKNAILELGPSGFPFERFIGELFKSRAYKIKVGKIENGTCVTHEVDVIASNEKEHLLIECKFHNQQGKLCDVKVPLYIHSRFNDVRSNWILIPEIKVKKIEGWVVTNTRFSEDAQQYGKCANLQLLGWDYPSSKGLKDLIDDNFLYPLTCLTSLNKTEKEKLLEKEIVLCEDLLSRKSTLKSIGLSDKRISTLMNEIENMKENK